MMKFFLLTLASLTAGASAAVLSLTPDNFAASTEGKTVFLKFFAPWCGHCKSMAADWEKLAGDWADDAVGVIAEIDCTAEGKPLCDANEVKGFPSIKYGDPSDLQDYKGARTYEPLAKFAKENLVPVCSIKNIALCDDEKKAEIDKFMKMDAAELDGMIAGGEDMIKNAEKTFDDALANLQSTYEKLSADKDKTVEAMKSAGMGLMKAVLASK